MKIYQRELLPIIRLCLFYFIFLNLIPSPGYGQHVYQLKPATEIPLLTAGVGGAVTSVLLRNKYKPLTADDLGQLNASDIFAIDHPATGNYGKGARVASDVFVSVSYAFPLTTLFLPDIRNDPGTIGVMLAEALLINETLTGITKSLVRRPRPFTYNQDVPENIRTGVGSNYSFFSGHTSYTATFSFFTAKVISDNIDNNTVKAVVWTGAILWPAATGYFRYKAGMHFPTDVITGYVVGASIGYFIPQLHKIKTKNENAKVQLSSLQVGPGFFQVAVAF
ncbi:MAG: phosphatase PAP2 family protein [Cyclobacteriaceae bacterium]